MKVKHTASVSAVCPVDKLKDTYTFEFTSSKVVFVEDIIACIEEYEGVEIAQEDLTLELSRRLCCGVKSTGFHSGIKTEVIV